MGGGLQACLEGQIQQLSVHAMLLGQPHAVVIPACFAKVVHCLGHLKQRSAALKAACCMLCYSSHSGAVEGCRSQV